MSSEEVSFFDESHDRNEGGVVHTSAEQLLVPIFAGPCTDRAEEGMGGGGKRREIERMHNGLRQCEIDTFNS